MKSTVIAALAVTLLTGLAMSQTEEFPKPAPPAKEHAWLQQLVGEWEVEMEMAEAPGTPPQKNKGTESVRSIGGYWIHSEFHCSMPGGPMTGIMTVGFNPETKTYVGTWIDSYSSHLWSYRGTVDGSGKILALEAEGPDMQDPSKKATYRDAIEVKGPDHKVLTSSVRGEDGAWTPFMTVHYRRSSASR